MTPPILTGIGLATLAIGWLVLRSFGSGYRIGRLLSGAPPVGIADAVALAGRADAPYVRVAGRIDSAAGFEDEHHRPLVFRRVRIEAHLEGGWRTIDEQRRAVPFEVHEGLDAIAVDHAALDIGLIVIPRLSTGAAGDVPGVLSAELPPETPVRVRVDQVSSVEHALVAGVPTAASDGTATLSAGRGRPLILTTLERDEAMRVLAGGDRIRPLAAALALGGGLTILVVGLGWAVVEAVA